LSDEAPILSPQSVQDFFRDLLSTAIQNQNAGVQPMTAEYVVNVLSAFLVSEQLYVREEDGSFQKRPLAFLLKDALEAEGPIRVRRLRQLGDTSLFISGFFPDSLSRSLVDVDYYIAMGGRAYGAVGDVAGRHGVEHRSLWDELAEKFRLFVDLLNEVSERTLMSTNAGLLRLYERWMKTGSVRLAGLLNQQGGLALAPVGVKGRFVQ
jgi:hypothetical protein